MISLKKYLDAVDSIAVKEENGAKTAGRRGEQDLLPATVSAYRAALREIGASSLEACPALGDELKRNLERLEANLSRNLTCAAIEEAKNSVQAQLQNWGRSTAVHFRQRTGEVKEILLVMARTAESVGDRDQRCAQQINEVTTRLKAVANLDDLSQIRFSIEKSATDLKTSIDRMAAEGKAAIDHLRAQVCTYQTKLEEAEEVASRDSLTGLRSRQYVENQMERRIDSKLPFCVAIVDIDRFKQVNDEHGHLAGDELLKQFAQELKSVFRAVDVIGRWGGDEFIILQDCTKDEAIAHSERLTRWVCGDYTIQGNSGPVKLRVDASIGLAECLANETINDVLARADAAMYQHKATSSAGDSRR